MKKLIYLVIYALCTLLFTACNRKKQFLISSEPTNGSPGDLVRVKAENLKDSKNAKVTIGQETAFIISASDSILTVMVPPSPARVTKLNVTAGKQQASTDFEVNQPATVRLWFSLNNDTARFVENQASNEEFVQDKSYTDNKIMYEVFNNQNKLLAVGYIDNPAEVEVPGLDHNSLAKAEVKGKIIFSINVPAFTDMSKVRFSIINTATNYRPKSIGEIAINKK